MEDAASVDSLQAGEQAAKVEPHTADGHVAEVVSEVLVLEVGEDGDDLVLVAECGDEGADGVGVAEVVEEFQLVEYTHGAAGYVYLFDRDVAWCVLSRAFGAFASVPPW